MKLSRPALLISFLALTTCGKDSTGPSEGGVESIVVNPPTSTVAIGASVGLSAQILDAEGNAVSDRSVHWASQDENIATVSEDGVVVGRRIGAVQVAASAGGRSGLAQINVTAVPVASVSLTPGNKALLVEQTFQFNAVARDAGGATLSGRPITWTSNNENVATVSPTGLVTALAPGGAIITASAEGKTDVASLTVSAIPVASVHVQPSTQALVEGQTAQLRAEPRDNAGKPLVDRVILWSTSNAGIATVTSSGLLTAQSPGTATITATVEGVKGTMSVTVTARPPNAVVVTPAQVIVQQGTTTQIQVQVLDDLGRPIPNSPVTLSSSDDAIATVSQAGVVTGVATGRATISATSGGKTGTAQVTVTPIPVGSVTVTPNAPSIQVGRTVTLTAQALSATGQPLTGRTVTWSSSTPGIAQVSTTGVVTGVSAGTTVVFASIDGVLGWATVTVVQVPVASVTVSPGSDTVQVGQSATFSVQLRDAGGSTLQGRIVGWSSSDVAIATVTNAGVVTGVAAGTAMIQATSEGQTGTATILVQSGVRTVTVTPDTATISPLGSVLLTAVVKDPTGTVINASVTWTTSNAAVALVSSSGMVSGLLPGTAVITARSGSASGTATITVK